jgi:hypothetical protein
MATTTHPLKDNLRANLCSLIEYCPAEKSNPQDCPLHLLRQIKRPQRVAWFQALPENDLVYLAAYHHVCLHTKTAFPPEI